MASAQGQSLQAIRDQAIANLLMLEQASAQMRFVVTYSINGRNYDWIGAKKYYTDEIDRLTSLMQKVDPFFIRTASR